MPINEKSTNNSVSAGKADGLQAPMINSVADVQKILANGGQLESHVRKPTVAPYVPSEMYKSVAQAVSPGIVSFDFHKMPLSTKTKLSVIDRPLTSDPEFLREINAAKYGNKKVTQPSGGAVKKNLAAQTGAKVKTITKGKTNDDIKITKHVVKIAKEAKKPNDGPKIVMDEVKNIDAKKPNDDMKIAKDMKTDIDAKKPNYDVKITKNVMRDNDAMTYKVEIAQLKAKRSDAHESPRKVIPRSEKVDPLPMPSESAVLSPRVLSPQTNNEVLGSHLVSAKLERSLVEDVPKINSPLENTAVVGAQEKSSDLVAPRMEITIDAVEKSSRLKSSRIEEANIKIDSILVSPRKETTGLVKAAAKKNSRLTSPRIESLLESPRVVIAGPQSPRDNISRVVSPRKINSRNSTPRNANQQMQDTSAVTTRIGSARGETPTSPRGERAAAPKPTADEIPNNGHDANPNINAPKGRCMAQIILGKLANFLKLLFSILVTIFEYRLDLISMGYFNGLCLFNAYYYESDLIDPVDMDANHADRLGVVASPTPLNRFLASTIFQAFLTFQLVMLVVVVLAYRRFRFNWKSVRLFYLVGGSVLILATYINLDQSLKTPYVTYGMLGLIALPLVVEFMISLNITVFVWLFGNRHE